MKIQAIWRKRNLKMKVKKMRLDFCLARKLKSRAQRKKPRHFNTFVTTVC
jgi:hypothetical protein